MGAQFKTPPETPQYDRVLCDVRVRFQRWGGPLYWSPIMTPGEFFLPVGWIVRHGSARDGKVAAFRSRAAEKQQNVNHFVLKWFGQQNINHFVL